jgi:hypothetical protein
MHLVVGTPMYGGMCCSQYVKSLLELKEAILQHGHQMTPIFVGNESLIPRARNLLAHLFLKTDASHLLFMDADQEFRANDVARMIKADKGIITGIVPMKGINWSGVEQAIKKKKKPPYEFYTGIFNFQYLKGHKYKNENEPFQIRVGGSGMMLIKREVFEELIPHTDYYENGGATIGKDKIYNFFKVENINKELLSEDYYFCHKYATIGGTIWAAPWCRVGHFGSYCFRGNYLDDLT